MYCLVNIPQFILDEKYIKYRNPQDFGGNTGNCLFWEATKNILRSQNFNLLSLSQFQKKPEYFQDKISLIVLAHANLIRNYNLDSSERHAIPQLEWIIRDHLSTLSPIKCKKYLISVGAQSSDLNYFKFKSKQKADYIKFFTLFDAVYLRGEYTYGLLEYNQIPLSNMTCVGCPSLILKPIDLNELNSKLETIKQIAISELNVGISIGGMVNRKDIVNNFMDLMSDKTVHTLVAGRKRWVQFTMGESLCPPIGRLQSVINPKLWFLKARIAKNRNNFVYNDNYLELIDYFRKKVHCLITTRIHSTILGTLAGVPSLCLVTDSRTYELCQQMGIPYLNCINQSIKWRNKKELIDIFLANCIFSEKINQTVNNMNEKYFVFSKSE